MNVSQLCQLASDWKGQVPPGGIMCEEKKDGFRALYFEGRDGVRRLWTRGGIPICGTDHITRRLAQMEAIAGRKLMFDGEFVVDGTLAATKAWFERGYKSGEDAGVLHVFDVLPFEHWQAGRCDTPLIDRKKWLKQLMEAKAPDDDGWTWRAGSHGRADPISVVYVPDTWVMDARDAIALASYVWAAGGEGIVLKDALAPYERKRSNAWQKVKQANEHKWREAA